MNLAVEPLKTFHVYKLVDGEWQFWMNARGKSKAQMQYAVWWRNKDKPMPVPYNSIMVKDPSEKESKQS